MIYFSIIIPAYNAEKYIELCLDSISKQSFNDYELIIINDGSTDHTFNICNRFALNKKQIHLINKENAGVSVARNVGLQQAEGEYVLFVDADDILYPNALSTLYEHLQGGKLDYLRFEFQTIDSDGKTLFPNYGARKRRKYAGVVCSSDFCIKNIVRNEFFLWSGVFRRSIIVEYNLRFLQGCTYCEDALFMMQFFRVSKRHEYANDVLYGYRKDAEAVTSNFTDKNYEDVRNVVDRIEKMSITEDSNFALAAKATVEYLCLMLLNTKNKKFLSDIHAIDFCKKNACTIEWKMIRSIGVLMFLRIQVVLILIRKIMNKI